MPAKNVSPIPLFASTIACGLFGIADDFVERSLIPEDYLITNPESTFFVRASGDSMSPEILENDILVVDRSLTPTSGDMIAVFLNNKPLCKRIKIQNKKVTLCSINPEFKDIEINENDEFHIFGVITGSMRKLRGN